MVVGSIEERIKKMKEAILSEANQRASTIVKNADEEASNERAMMFNHQKQKIHQEFIQLNKNQKVKEKIERSAVNNRHRIRRMEARYEFVEKLKEEVRDRLLEVTQDQEKYKELVEKLILQGMLRMMERNVTIELKAEHYDLAKSVFSNCSRRFAEIMEKETGRSMDSNLTLSVFQLEEMNKKIIGGVFLRSSDGVIVCDNSIDSRVRLIFEQLLPQIRASLFPKKQPTSTVKGSTVQGESSLI